MRQFCWLAAGEVPAAFDLRRLGWRLSAGASFSNESASCPQFVLPARLSLSPWLRLVASPAAERRWTALLGIDDPLRRSALLRSGFGDAFSWNVSLDELAVRTERLIERAITVPRKRHIGALTLDLIARDGFVAGRRLGLFPREFALVWRLAELPGRAVSSGELLCDVWRLFFRPETNSLAVHVSRLRAKLRLAGLDGLIETTAEGAYRLLIEPPQRGDRGLAEPSCELALDALPRLGKEKLTEAISTEGQEPGHAA